MIGYAEHSEFTYTKTQKARIYTGFLSVYCQPLLVYAERIITPTQS